MASKKRPAKNPSSVPVSGVRGRSYMPPERVSQTKMTRVEVDEAVTTERENALRSLPSTWLEALVAVMTELPTDRGEDAVVRAVVDAVARILPSYAVGACFATAEGQRVYRRIPLAEESREAGVDPSRLFPSFARERVASAGGAHVGLTLHLATDDAFEDAVSEAALAERAARLIARGIEQARAHAEAARAKRDLVALESRAIQADKLASFGQIAASLVHELNNPLTSIVAYSDYLVRRVAVRPESRLEGDDVEKLRRIGESANRMLRFTRDLVSYARPSSEVAVPLVLHNVIDQAIAFCEHVVSGAGATIERRYSSEVRTVRGMPEQLTQVFVNLLTNAVQAMPSGGGRIVVATRAAPDGGVAIAITDDGHGIAAGELPHIFTPFFTTKRDGGGTGLGLSIVKSIVDRHGGTIEVASTRPGGTTFTIGLPVGAAIGSR